MKTTLVIAGILALGISVYANDLKEKVVPAAVKAKFAAMYPNVKDAKWDMEDGAYEAEFGSKANETAVLFKKNGTLVQTEVEIAVSSLPKGASDYAAEKLAGKKIAEATKITDAKGNIRYEAEIGDADYMFDANGKFLSKKSEGKEEDDKDDDK